MHSLLSAIKGFLTKDVKNEMETKDLAVLLRILSILYSVFFITITPLLALMTYYTIAILLLFGVGSLLACFILTYEEKTNISLRIFYITILTFSSLLTVSAGWSFNFQWNFLIILLISYFNLNMSKKEKKQKTIIVYCIAATTTFIALFFPVLREPEPAMKILCQLLTLVYYMLIFTVIAYLYSIKFNQSEEKLRQTNEKLLRMASLDALTQLPNRRSMNEHLSTLIYDNKRTGKEFCIAIADVDFFKRINDEYGHETGDYILTTLSEIFRDAMSNVGFVARWGGEEFLFTYEGMTMQQAFSQLELLRIRIAEHPFIHKGTQVHITVTFGLEEYSSILTPESAISRADAKLYQGKAEGRNRVIC